MKDVLISIKPSWCLCIAIGAKTVELRKNRPRLKTPFKVYIYCTKSSKKRRLCESAQRRLAANGWFYHWRVHL